uniref:Beta-ribofuranosylaminobenzene 5'-phosphate synthase n=1 Tax=Gemmata sp. Wa1-1 TaxID=235140 RepID=Q6R3I6_9BACT|nr:beta-ribofuranosylaminobenzene 5'-phosphate synthase [Gemmata sp. Wa1-1]
MIRVVAPSRLHFGLFRVPVVGESEAGARAFGGAGLMIDHPGVVVTVRPADSWQFEGPLASRAQIFAMRFMLALPEERRRPFQVLVERCPAEHTGLGVGTQLGLAVAKALAVANREGELPSTELAARIGRGERSAIGVYGFDRGGLLIDSGKLPGEDLSPLLARVSLPDEWRVVLFTPAVAAHWHGPNERQAFATAVPGDPEALRRLAETALLPAAQRGDIDMFGDAVHEFNRKAGEPFSAAQGGEYASPDIAALIENVRACGVRGAGQSSWGPTVFAIVSDSDTALSLVLRFRSRVPCFVTRISAGYRTDRVGVS